MGILENFRVLFGKKTQQPATPVTPKKIVIVEDDKFLADSIKAKLQQEGYRVVEAADGKAGLDAINREKPDLVVLDLIMPVMSGNTMLHELRKIPAYSTLPVVVLTNAGTVDNMHNTMFYDHAVDFIVKSNVTLEEIAVRVKRYLGR